MGRSRKAWGSAFPVVGPFSSRLYSAISDVTLGTVAETRAILSVAISVADFSAAKHECPVPAYAALIDARSTVQRALYPSAT